MRGATYCAGTKWPEGFDPQLAGAVLVKDEDWPAGCGCIVMNMADKKYRIQTNSITVE